MIKIKKNIKPAESVTKSGNIYSLILFNDNVNSFDFVVATLMEVCEHDGEQAYQCALIAHHRGKCEVKKGKKEDLKNRCSLMINRGLSAEIISKDYQQS